MTYENTFLHNIEPNQFVDSIEFDLLSHDTAPRELPLYHQVSTAIVVNCKVSKRKQWGFLT